jgi:hypothetical protein
MTDRKHRLYKPVFAAPTDQTAVFPDTRDIYVIL